MGSHRQLTPSSAANSTAGSSRGDGGSAAGKRQRGRTSSTVTTLAMSEAELKTRRTMANQRERRRTEELNEAFRRLRHVVPSMPSDKMSKIHTLRIASDYIRFLDTINKEHHVLRESPMPSCCTTGMLGEPSPPLSIEEPNQATTITTLRNSFNSWRSVVLYQPLSYVNIASACSVPLSPQFNGLTLPLAAADKQLGNNTTRATDYPTMGPFASYGFDSSLAQPSCIPAANFFGSSTTLLYAAYEDQHRL